RKPCRVADMIGMAMGQRDQIDLLQRVFITRREFSIAGEEGVDENICAADFDVEGRMPVPGEPHGRFLSMLLVCQGNLNRLCPCRNAWVRSLCGLISTPCGLPLSW